MSGNRLKKQDIAESPEVSPVEGADDRPVRRKKSSLFRLNWLKMFNVFDWFDRNKIVHNMSFILFIAALILFYISNSYYAERIIRDIDKTKLELREKSAEFISTRSQLMFESKQSAVAERAAQYGLKESTSPPHTLTIKKESKEDPKE
jgi:hypothetical protein